MILCGLILKAIIISLKLFKLIEIDTWQMSPRGAGWFFGGRVTREFNELNGLDLVCRAH